MCYLLQEQQILNRLEENKDLLQEYECTKNQLESSQSTMDKMMVVLNEKEERITHLEKANKQTEVSSST